jgi:serine/threonine-protein kinase RsbT
MQRTPDHPERWLPIAHSVDVVACRRMVSQVASTLSFSETAKTMLVTAASELARNTLIHGGGGSFSWEIIIAQRGRGLRLRFEDKGPGIADLEKAMANGWSSGQGMGLGLPGAKRLVDEFEICSHPNEGTSVTITRYADRESGVPGIRKTHPRQ